MTLRFTFGVLFFVSLVSIGCSSKPAEGPRLTTTPLSGTVYVDGEPAEFLMVECHPEAGTSELKHPMFAMTDAQGNFLFAMYQAGDGLPEGKYRLAFKWEGFGAAKKDKLKGAYSNPAKSKHEVTIADGESNDLGVIELSTKGPVK
jgi:hypothetical protein